MVVVAPILQGVHNLLGGARDPETLAVPIWTAVAPASMNSITSAAVEMPPMPMTGISTA